MTTKRTTIQMRMSIRQTSAAEVRVAVLITLLMALLMARPVFAQEDATVMQTVTTQAGDVAVEELADGLTHPWGLAFLPDGRMLVTERAGTVRILDPNGSLSDPLVGTPEVFAQGQGGMLEVALDPEFESNSLVYLSYAAPGPDGTAASALGRGRLENGSIEGFEELFRQEPWVEGENHFGGRIVFTPENRIFFTLGERFQFDPAQDPSNHLGTIIRINRDGSVPADNPFVGTAEGADEIWSYGHRNIESAGIHPTSGELWVAEMGPEGGDELNQPEAGENYGWPVVSWGDHYDGTEIPDPPTHPEFADALIHWTPVISPSGMTFYTGQEFPEWQGSALIGGLTAQGLVRVQIDGENAEEVERIALGERIREVEQGPDGSLYVLTDVPDGSVWRLRPHVDEVQP